MEAAVLLRYRHTAADRLDQDISSALKSGRRSELAGPEGLGRTETCIVNAAIMAMRRHGGGSSGPQYNKPIIVDVDLPVWDRAGEEAG